MSDELERLARAATPGPWVRGSVNGRCRKESHQSGRHPGERGVDPCVYTYAIHTDETDCSVVIAPNITLIGGDDYGPILSKENAAYIAAASPDVILALLSERRELVAGLREALGWARLPLDPTKRGRILALSALAARIAPNQDGE